MPDADRNHRTRAMWAELHARAFNAADLSSEREWLEKFAQRVPCGECRRHWRELVKLHPPDLSSPDAYFAWTVARHNDVSRRLGKPEWTVEQVRAHYGRTVTADLEANAKSPQ